MSDLNAVAPARSDLPKGDRITLYDHQHMVTYLSLLYAAGKGTRVEDMACEILRLAPDLDPIISRSIVEDHLARARWLAISGYKHLLESKTDIAS